MKPISDVGGISRLAYGFMGSKALFAALNLDLFTLVSEGADSTQALAEKTAIDGARMETLLAALAAVGLIARDGGRVTNAPASEQYLVRTAPAYFGDYYRYQIDKYVYPSLMHLDVGLRGEHPDRVYERTAQSQQDADDFSRAQHAGSTGPALMLAKAVDLRGCATLLDVGGGSGAFAIALCERYPGLKATVMDFATVLETAKRHVAEAGLNTRIDFHPTDATDAEWPGGQGAVLMSYLMSAVARDVHSVLLQRAWKALDAGGILIVHDFMLDSARTGPDMAALWFLPHMVWVPGAVSLSRPELASTLTEQGFEHVTVRELIPDITSMVVCRKPA